MSDLIRREDVITVLCFCEETKMMLCKELRKILEKINKIPSAEPEPEEFEWCTDCKEYDQEKHCCHRWTKVIRQTVEEMKSADPERKWIPVTEALPEDNRQVLVYAQSTHFVLAKYDEMMEPNGEWKKQWVTFDAWKPYYTVKNVIAWMTLPEPWRGE